MGGLQAKLSEAKISKQSTPLNIFDKNKFPIRSSLSWDEFVSLKPFHHSATQLLSLDNIKPQPLSAEFEPVYVCPPAIKSLATKPFLSPANISWCKYALDADGGQVVVGKSWGKFAKDHSKQEVFEELNCNAYAKGMIVDFIMNSSYFILCCFNVTTF